MKRVGVVLLILGLIVIGCSTAVVEDELPPAVETPEELEVESELPADPAPTQDGSTSGQFEGHPLPLDQDVLFSGSGACATCHQKLVDESGADVSMDRMWRSTMMANAARDPYWVAAVRSEMINNPDLAGVIEDKCSTCHTPMARFTYHANGEPGALFEGGFFDPDHELHAIAMDGVACNLCHQVQPDNFGDQESFSGGYLIDTQLPMGERLSYGPFQVDSQNAQVMTSVSGFIPVQGLHIEESEICAVCHTLFTPYLDSDDEIAGVFPEQNIYQEWLNSAYAGEKSCQGCHMPTAQGSVQISMTGGPPREPFYQHLFVGGNAYMMEIFQHFGDEMEVTASSQQFADSQTAIQEQLGQRTANITLADMRIEDGQLKGQVQVASQVGHKFPAGFPSRRAWLHIRVLDAGGNIVFESGAVNADGSIVGNDNDADGQNFEPHYMEITEPGQVQIYEGIMLDTEGQVTTTLLRSAAYAKDNRLLPDGLDKALTGEDFAVYGSALDDANFLGGTDSLELVIDLDGAQGTFTVQVELLYQSIAFRWANNLRQIQSAETERFMGYYDAVENLPLIVATIEEQVE